VAMLQRPLVLGDLADVESVCVGIVQHSLNGSAAHLRHAQFEEAVAYLIGETWILWRRYDPERAKFATYAYPLLRNRMIDFWRSQLGSSRSAPRPTIVSLDELDDSELERALSGGDRDDPAYSDPDLAGLLESRSGERRRMDDAAGRRAPASAPRRIARPQRNRRTDAA